MILLDNLPWTAPLRNPSDIFSVISSRWWSSASVFKITYFPQTCPKTCQSHWFEVATATSNVLGSICLMGIQIQPERIWVKLKAVIFVPTTLIFKKHSRKSLRNSSNNSFTKSSKSSFVSFFKNFLHTWKIFHGLL